MKWIGTPVLAMILLVGGPGRDQSIAAATSWPLAIRGSQTSDASAAPTDISARRHVRHHHRYYHAGYRHYRHVYRPYYPRYYARPYYYEPAPNYAPLPFGFSFGVGPWW